MTDVLIVGAGAAGLSAGRILSKHGWSVMILEARDRIGGRIHTINGQDFSFPVEAGAEFMHGDLPFTKALMNEAHVSYFAGDGRTWTITSNKLSEGDLFHDDWHVLVDKLQQLDHDMTIGQFLELHFKEPRYRSLADAVKKFVEGYDAADINKVSALALKEEWSNDNIKGYRPNGGYSQLMDYLWSEIEQHQGQMCLSAVVRKIVWKRNEVEVFTSNNERLKANKILITVPVSVLKSAAIEFDPLLTSHEKAFQHIEVGGVIKFLVEFRNRIWEKGVHVRQMPGLNFLFSDAVVPTWWTQNPNNVPLLTGWLAGPGLKKLPSDGKELQELAFQSLAYLFSVSQERVGQEVKAIRVINWDADPFARGAYAYSTLESPQAVKIILQPKENTIFFAGEALYEGAEIGTVEAALASGHRTANAMIREVR
jgi:monoamine oxidase